MPLYDFRCPQCGLEFEVSRPMSRSSEPAYCLMDNTECERIMTMPMTFVRNYSGDLPPPPPQTPQAGGGGWSHFGHSHGAGSGTHSHGPGDV